MTTFAPKASNGPATSPAGSADTADSDALAEFGYQQQLHRKLGSYASFAAGFSFISVLTAVFQLFAFGFSFGGPAFFWSWPLVFGGQLLVALCFSELAARYPISGAIYQWSRRLTNQAFGWFTGWLMLIGQIVVVAADALALQVVLPSVWSGFQFAGGDPSITTRTGATNAVLLGVILIVITTLINLVGVELMSRVNLIGVTCELVGIAAMVLLLLTHSKRSPSIVTHTLGAGSHGGYFFAFIISAFTAAYVLVGFDSAGELSEETRDPRGTTPRTIRRALIAAGIGGGFLIFAALLAAPSVSDGKLATEGLPYVLTSRLGDSVGRILLIDVAIAITVATLAAQTAASRVIFSLARDRVLPFSKSLSHVSERSGAPAVPSLVVGGVACAVLLLNIGQQSALLALQTTCIVLIYLAYAMITGPLLYRRLKGWPRVGAPTGTTATGKPLFTMGKWGVPVNALALVFGLVMAVNLAWPRKSVYDPIAGHWYLKWFSVMFIIGALIVGYAAYRSQRRTAAMQRATEEAKVLGVDGSAA